MAKSEFRIVGHALPAKPQQPTVKLTLGELLPLVAHAQRQGHPWLADLADDQIVVTADLAEVLARFRDIVSSKPA